MPSESVILSEKLQQFGYELVGPSDVTNAGYIEVSGGQLEEVTAFLQSDKSFCTAAFLVGVLQAVPDRLRYSFLIDLLELNFGGSLGSISLFRSNPKKESEGYYLILAQTSFFWPEMTKEKLDARMRSLRAVGLSASKLLAAKGAISNTNPFFSQLKPAAV